MYHLGLVAKQPALPHHGDDLREHSGQGGTLYAHVQRPDEQRREDDVQEHAQYGGIHGVSGFSRCPQQCIRPEEQMRERIAQQDDNHVFAGIGQRSLTGTEEFQYGVEKEQRNDSKRHTHDDVQGDARPEYLLGHSVVLLPQINGYTSGRTYAHRCTEGGGKIHEGKGDGQSADGQCAHSLSDEYAVGDVIQ